MPEAAPAVENGAWAVADALTQIEEDGQHATDDLQVVVAEEESQDSLLEDLQDIRHFYASSHLSDVLFVCSSENATAIPGSLGTAMEPAGRRSSERGRRPSAVITTPEHHLLPAHRLVLALRSGTFQTALWRTKSSQVPGQVRFPVKIHIEDTSFPVFATLLRFLYTNEVVHDQQDKPNDEFWKELLRAAFLYLVPSLVEICVQRLEDLLNGTPQLMHESVGAEDDGHSLEEQAIYDAPWESWQLHKVLEVLVFLDAVLASKPASAARRRISSKGQVSGVVDFASDSKKVDELAPTELPDSPGFARCMAAISRLQYMCLNKLKSVAEKPFETLIRSEIGRRCSTEILRDILRERSDTPLVVAIRYQLGRVVNELLRLGEPLDRTGADETDLPLVAALATGNDAIIRRLLVEEDAPYFLLTDKIPLFILACASGSVLHCQILIDRSNANVNLISPLEDGDKEILSVFGHKQTPLHIASRKGHADVVELLLRNNAASNLQDDEGNTPLHYAANMQTAEILLSPTYRTNPNIPNRRGLTPLHVAAAGGSVGIVDLLIRNGAQHDIMDDQGQTAFHVAAANGHTSVALVLLHEQEPRAQKLHQKKPRKAQTNDSEAASNADEDTQTESDDMEEEAPATFDINQEDLKGNSALHLAAMSPSERCQKMLQLLLENGSDPNKANWFGYTPLHLFCAHQGGPASVIDMFVRIIASDLCMSSWRLT